MLGVAGILAQEILKPDVFFYNAGLPENIPDLYFGGPSGKVIAPRTPCTSMEHTHSEQSSKTDKQGPSTKH